MVTARQCRPVVPRLTALGYYNPLPTLDLLPVVAAADAHAIASALVGLRGRVAARQHALATWQQLLPSIIRCRRLRGPT